MEQTNETRLDTLLGTPLTDEERARMRYNPATDRTFSTDARGHPVLTLGHECNSPIYALCGLALCVARDKPPTWKPRRRRTSWTFQTVGGHPDDCIIITPRFAWGVIEDLPDSGVWDARFFSIAVKRQRTRDGQSQTQRIGTTLGQIDSYDHTVTLQAYFRGQETEDLTAAAEVIEALSTDTGAVLARESDHCCFCGKALTDPFSRAHGYGPECAQRYGLGRGQHRLPNEPPHVSVEQTAFRDSIPHEVKTD